VLCAELDSPAVARRPQGGDMTGSPRAGTTALEVQAPNGVVWTRRPDGRSSQSDLLTQLIDLCKGHIEREWDWSPRTGARPAVGCSRRVGQRCGAAGRRSRSGSRGAGVARRIRPAARVERRKRADLAATDYDEPRETMRLTLLRRGRCSVLRPHCGPTRQPGTAGQG
jgi:hypothetical protein